jgi:hypothetical protein
MKKHHRSDDGGGKHLWNVGQFLSDSTAQYHRRQSSSWLAETERRGRVVNTRTSYSVGPGFDSLPRRPANLIEIFRVFTQSLKANAGKVPYN